MESEDLTTVATRPVPDPVEPLPPKGMLKCNVHIIPTSDHNMHMDNPDALARSIINDIYDLKLPLRPNKFLMRASRDVDDDTTSYSAVNDCFENQGIL